MKNIILPIILIFLQINLIVQANIVSVQKVIANERERNDFYGTSVSISNKYAIIGSPYDNDNLDGMLITESIGAAYLYEIDGTSNSWSLINKLTASDKTEGDGFGVSVSLNGEYAIVGSPYEDEDEHGSNIAKDAGAAYIYKRDSQSGKWKEEQKLVASDRTVTDHFGFSVAISGDYAVIGSYQDDEDENGINSVHLAGSAYIFKRNSDTGVWEEEQKLVASSRNSSDFFGRSVAISGNYVIIGKYADNYDENEENNFNRSGSAYIFERDNDSGEWVEAQKIVASDRGDAGWFGYSVSINGNYAIIGSHFDSEDKNGDNYIFYSGSAYIFERDNSSGKWVETQKIVANERNFNDRFGFSVSINQDYAVVGSQQDDEDENEDVEVYNAGSAYVFKRDNSSGEWAQEQKLVAFDRQLEDELGYSVAISGNKVVVGTIKEDDDETGDDVVLSVGAAYIFKIDTAATSIDIERKAAGAIQIGIEPNPNNGNAMIKIAGNSIDEAYISNALGERVATIDVKSQSGAISYQLQGARLPSGQYYVIIESESGIQSKRMFVIE